MPQNSVKPLHIAIDARMYGVAQRGIGRYLMKLIERLEEVDPAPTPPTPPSGRGGNCYTIFLRWANFEEYQPKNPHFKKVLWDAGWYGIREQLTTSYVLRTNPDLVHFPHWNVPLLFRRPFVVTIHDLELFSSNRTRGNTTRGRFMYWFKFQMFKIIFRHAVLASRAIIVPSNAVREQLLDRYPQVRKKVKVIYEAPTLSAISNSLLDISKSNSQYPIANSQFALYIGAAYPHKNLPRLLEAWQLVHQELPEYKLVLVGREDWFWKKLKQQLSNSQYLIANSILWYGEATDAELATLYKNAALLVQPSLEEGFSLSPLEALAHGCPVAVSDIPVHREILGDAAIYFEPHDPQTIAAAIKKVVTNAHARDRILHQAKAQLLRYSWRNHAKETLRLYAQACLE